MSKWNSLLVFFLGLALASPCTLKAAGQTVHMQFKGLAASLPVAISLTWTGSGQLANFEDHSNVRQPALSFKSTMRESGTFRPATATGSIS